MSKANASGLDPQTVYSITVVCRGTRSHCRRPTHIHRGRFDPAHSRVERWGGRRLAPRYRTRRPGSDTTAVGAASGRREGVLPVGGVLCQPVVDGWSTAAVGLCRGHRALGAERRRLGPTPRRDR